MPLARATGMGAILDCADHSYKVCFLQRSTISAPVMGGIVVVVMFLTEPRCAQHISGAVEVTSPFQCAGLNRHEAEEEEASRERTSDPLGPEFCVGYREVHD